MVPVILRLRAVAIGVRVFVVVMVRGRHARALGLDGGRRASDAIPLRLARGVCGRVIVRRFRFRRLASAHI